MIVRFYTNTGCKPNLIQPNGKAKQRLGLIKMIFISALKGQFTLSWAFSPQNAIIQFNPRRCLWAEFICPCRAKKI
jgi:hypothetical protein